MPDPKQMSGIPRPVDDLPNGAISVRLIRGSLSNNITGHPVELHVGAKVLTVKTDENGRAEFKDFITGPDGAQVKATADVDGEHLESQEFPAPTRGGIRLMLVATDTTKGPATTPDGAAISGQLVIGDQSRIVIQPGDDGVQVFYLLDIANNARAPVNPATPFVFALPSDALGATLMEGSSPTAVVKSGRVTVQGPFAPGHTFVQIAYELPLGNGSQIAQTFPPVRKLAVVVKGRRHHAQRAQIAAARGRPRGISSPPGALRAAGQPIERTLGRYTHCRPAPRIIALSLAVVIIVAGAWAARGTDEDPASRAAERKRVVTRREKLFADLVRLEHDRRAGRVDDRRYGARREEIVGALEQIYGSLDTQDAGPQPAERGGLAAPAGALGAP